MGQGWRGIVGLVLPTYRPGLLEETIRFLPDGIGVIPLYIGIKTGSEGEFTEALRIAEDRVDELASIGRLYGMELINIHGSPPFMLLGYDADHKLAERLSQKHGIPVTTASTALVKALKALSVKKVLAITYLTDAVNQKSTKYLTDAGFQVVAMQGMGGEFKAAGKIPDTEVYAFAKRTFLELGGADAIYLKGGGWRVLSIIEKLESDLQTTVVSSSQIGLWEILTSLKVREPTKGYGKLLSDML